MATQGTMTLEDLFGGEVPAYLTAGEVATLLRLHTSTVRRQCEAGDYDHAFRLPGAKKKKDLGDWRIPSRFLERKLRHAEETGEFA
jgi:hypothetical protein